MEMEKEEGVSLLVLGEEYGETVFNLKKGS